MDACAQVQEEYEKISEQPVPRPSKKPRNSEFVEEEINRNRTIKCHL